MRDEIRALFCALWALGLSLDWFSGGMVIGLDANEGWVSRNS